MAADKAVYNSVPQDEKCEDTPVHGPPKGCGMRHTQALVLFISITVGFFLRTHLSVSMVAMTRAPTIQNVIFNTSEVINDTTNNATEIFETNETYAASGDGICDGADSLDDRSVYQTYNWSRSAQDMIIYSFFVGYSIMMFPMGLIAQRFGGKLPIMVALGTNGVLSILTPWVPMFVSMQYEGLATSDAEPTAVWADALLRGDRRRPKESGRMHMDIGPGVVAFIGEDLISSSA